MSDNFLVKDGFKELHIVRTGKDRFYDITGCKPFHDGTLHDFDGALVNATVVPAEYVASLIADSEARDELRRVETLLRDVIDLRRSRSRMAKQRLRQLQKPKQEVVQ